MRHLDVVVTDPMRPEAIHDGAEVGRAVVDVAVVVVGVKEVDEVVIEVVRVAVAREMPERVDERGAQDFPQVPQRRSDDQAVVVGFAAGVVRENPIGVDASDVVRG